MFNIIYKVVYHSVSLRRSNATAVVKRTSNYFVDVEIIHVLFFHYPLGSIYNQTSGYFRRYMLILNQ